METTTKVINQSANLITEIPYKGKTITNLRITNISLLPISVDLYLENIIPDVAPNNTLTYEKFYITKDLVINNQASVDFDSEDIYIQPGMRLFIYTPTPVSFTALYRIQ